MKIHLFRVTALIVAGAFLSCRASSPEFGQTPETLTLDLGSGVRMDFVLIPAGSFPMGTDENSGDGDESPIHQVQISRPFYIGRTEVTQAQWSQLMRSNPSHFKGPDLPVETVSWYAAKEFIAALRARTGRCAKLPTEAQWEYACRASTVSAWSFGDDEASAPTFAWHAGNSGDQTRKVGALKANPWGLQDMHGNVWEWCEDWYNKGTYRGGDASDPVGPPSGDGRVLRGGAWGDAPHMLRSTARNCAGPEVANHGIGFRCVLALEDAPGPITTATTKSPSAALTQTGDSPQTLGATANQTPATDAASGLR